jgi:hypothetical protein
MLLVLLREAEHAPGVRLLAPLTAATVLEATTLCNLLLHVWTDLV